MSDEKTAILIRALEASGSEREAQLARAILGDPAAAPAAPAAVVPAVPAEVAAPAAPAAPEIPSAPMVPAPVAAATPQGPQPPAGKAPLLTQADVEGISQAEYEARYAEVEAVLRGGA